MKNKYFFSFVSLFICLNVFSQNRNILNPKYEQLFKTIPIVKSDAPKWVHLLYNFNPNYYKIEKAFHNYYKDHIFEKNIHTQNFKYFSKIIHNHDYLKDNGDIHIPSLSELEKNATRVLRSRSSSKKNTSTANWIPLGPFETFKNGGVEQKSSQVNAYAFAQSTVNPNILYVGAETSGVYKSTDKGLNWSSIGDFVFNDGSIQSIEIDPTNPEIVYISVGNKLYKTMDGGTNWNVLLNEWNLKITAITINNNNPQIVLVAGNSGLKRSTDGGSSWTTVFTDRCWDIKLKTDDPNTVFLAKKNITKNITELLKSTDNGITFSTKNNGWFSPIGGVAASDGGARIGVTNADSNRVYVVLLGEENDNVDDNNYIGIYRSDNAGESWTTPYDGNSDGTPDNEPGGPYSSNHWCFTHFGVTTTGYNQGYYDLDIEVSDINPDHIMMGSLNLFKSEDGGVTYTRWGGYGCTGCGSEYRHPDIQEIEMNGNDVWVCSDGGIDYYDANLDFVESRNNGINGSDYWGFDQGWNHDVFVGGRYHNGNAAFYENYPFGKFLSLGGAESATGYVNKGENRKVYHSDISGKEIPEEITGTITNISKYALFPNESYVFSNRSEIVNDPRYWNTLYLGKENKLWKSDNGGQSFNLVKEFGSDTGNFVRAIEISRNNPNIIFITQRHGNSGKLWKSVDNGQNWTEVLIPAKHKTMYLSLNTNDELFLGLNNGFSNSNKIFKSSDWGNSWNNLTTSTLNGEKITNIQVQDGTDGGIYITSNKMIWYRNNGHADWQSFSDNLPLHLRIIKILPFYKKEKLRIASNRGIWESDFFERSLPKAQPMVVKQTINCNRYEVQFEDYSILNHDQASWEWTFPGANLLTSSNIRNPRVIYPSPGEYSVSLKVTDKHGNISDKTVTKLITVGDDYCATESEPKMALACNQTNDYVSNNSINEENISNFSFTAWIKPNDIQPNYAAIFSLSEGCVLNFRESNNTLGIHWKGGNYWWWDSNLEVPADEWSYVAITVTPSKITLYLNEKSHSWSLTTAPFNLTQINLGTYYQWESRNYKGLIEEATFWKRALTAKEIRLARHLTKADVSDNNILAYYQFNNESSGTIYDKKGANDLNLNGNAVLVTSDAPIGYGKSSSLNINSDGTANFVDANCKMIFNSNGTIPNGAVVVSKINVNPSVLPSTNTVDDTYWIINNYGTNQTFDAIENITFSNLNNINTLNSNEVVLFKRNSNDGATSDWGTYIEEAININSSELGATFSNSGSIDSFGQFYIGSKKALNINNENKNQFLVYPNPLNKGGYLYFKNINNKARITIYDINGKQLLKKIITDKVPLKTTLLSTGMYFYTIETATKIENGKLLID
ncbi:LamG-like jellyroll fold domain-containing protein [Tenacibaculum sp. nBUS_03]|uniref:LamG-like jellyroll fold domain-containing protein n=1 Tax=Tenacibaculum sp. nBUS_03 TaxID=3395320 RepID=UPI003EBEE357